MNVLILGRYAFCSGVAIAFLAGCGGSQSVPVTAPVVGPAGGALKKQSHTFNFTGSEQTFKVPKGVKSISVDAYGGGTSTGDPPKEERAFGGRTQATLPVTPGETLVVMVGGETGFNGGGSPGTVGSYGGCYVTGDGNGAGASDVREHGSGFSNRILVAGGGGGNEGERGGFGGALIGGTGGGGHTGKSGRGGTGGTQSAGGAGGAGGKYGGIAGNPGALGVGGNGGPANVYASICGAGGGGGYYGGGGGGSGGNGSGTAGGNGGGGGGGSSYTEPSAKNVALWQGWKTATGNGLVVFSWK